jgi:hypothetical protein
MRMAVCMLCFHFEVKLLYLGGDTKMLCCFMDLGNLRDWLLIGQLATTCRSSMMFIAKEFVALESRQATYLGEGLAVGKFRGEGNGNPWDAGSLLHEK